MADKCGKCQQDVLLGRDTIKCTECSSDFHLTCAKSEGSKKISSRTTSWKCGACTSENASVSSKGDNERDGHSTILDAIAAFRKENNETIAEFRNENNEKWNTINTKLDEVKGNIVKVTADVEDAKKQINDLKTENEDVKERIVNFEKLYYEISGEVRIMRIEMNEIQQYSRVDNIIIAGVPVTKGEDFNVLLAKIASLLRLSYNPYHISAAHRLPLFSEGNRHPPIVVKFTSRAIKNDWVYARKNKRNLMANELNDKFPNTPIYFNEHMTARTREIFNKGRDLVREQKLAYVWVKDGRVLVKKTPKSRTVRVREINDFNHVCAAYRSPATSEGDITLDTSACAPGASSQPPPSQPSAPPATTAATPQS